MDSIIAYFETIPSLHRTIILISGLTFFWIVEGVIPLSRKKYGKIRHAGTNLFFTLTTLIVNFLFAFLIVRAADYVTESSIGVVQWFNLPLVVKIVVGILFLDLIGAYFIHWIQHKIPWMWKYHVVHHSDTTVDTTTALRHHPGESVFRATFTLLAIIVSGSPIWLVMIYQSLSAVLSQFNHANISIPKWANKIIFFVIVTPEMHRVHHHKTRPFTDKNYGNIFSFWDKIFKTFDVLEPSEIKYGLDVFDKNENNVKDLLLVPFDGSSYSDAL